MLVAFLRSSAAAVRSSWLPHLRTKGTRLHAPFFQAQCVHGKMEGIVCERISKENSEKAILHLRNNFFADEPLNKSVGLVKRGQPHKELEEFSLDIISQGLSYMAIFTATGEVVGVLLNGYEDGEKHDEKLYKDQKLQKIFDFLGSAVKDIEYLSKFNASSVLELKIVSVDSKFRGRGVGVELYKISEMLARDKGFVLLRADCTSLFSQKLFLKFGFKVVKEVFYDEYPTKEAPLFNVEAPHVSFRVLVKELKTDTTSNQNES